MHLLQTVLCLALAVGALAEKVTYQAKYAQGGMSGSGGREAARGEVPVEKAGRILDNMFTWSGGRFDAYGSRHANDHITIYAVASVNTKSQALDEIKQMQSIVANH